MGKPKLQVVPDKKGTKLGKNKKKSWKQIQHRDVDDFLDDLRQDERLGGISTKTDDELFTIDIKGVDSTETWTRRSIPTERNKEGPLVVIDDLRCYQLLKPHTQVPDPLIKRNRVKLPGEGKSEIMKLKDIRRQNKRIKRLVPVKPEGADPWDYVEPKGILDSEWVPDSVKRHNLRPRIAPPAKKYNTSELPAIPAPHPGFSYNPTFDDHQDLLKLAVKKEVAKQRKERNLIKATAVLQCATAGELKEESSGEEEEEEDEDKKKNPDPKARTRQSKRKEREEKEKVRGQKEKKEDNARMNEVFRIKTIQKEIKASEVKSKTRLLKLVEKKVYRESLGKRS